MVLKILQYPHPLLRQFSDPVKEITEEIHVLASNMADTMGSVGGIGLSAVQVGKSLRMFVMLNNDLANLIDQQYPTSVFINPEIIKTEGNQRLQEGCLSFPGKFVTKLRPETVELKYLNLDGKEQIVRLKGIRAVCAIHEMEHLDGKLLVDKKKK